jgi:predicted deacylase
MLGGHLKRRSIFAALFVLVAALASGCGAFSIGNSHEGRPLAMRTFGDGPAVVMLVGGLHTGGEDNTRVMVEQIAAYLDAHPEAVPASVTVYVLASANPDGTARGIHTNARGVDLNRNWPADNWLADTCHPASGCRRGLGGPAPLSEPETYALYHFIHDVRPVITAVWHSEAPLVEANEVAGADTYARIFGDAAGCPYIEEWSAYRITGQLIDALEQRLGYRAFDIELTECCRVSPQEIDRNVAGVRALLDAVDRAQNPDRPTTPRSPTPRPTRTRGLPPIPTATPDQ